MKKLPAVGASEETSAKTMAVNVATTYTDETSVLADMQSTGPMSTLFNATVMVLTVLWPWMICVPDRTINQEEFAVATAPGTTYAEDCAVSGEQFRALQTAG